MRYFLTAAAVTVIFTAQAQQLKTEVTVDRTVDTSVETAVRPKGLVPSLVLPQVKVPGMSAAEYTAPGTITTEISATSPAQWGDTIPHTPYRGYASLGYFPTFNLGANAGYRFVDHPRGNAGVWMQYDGNSYRTDPTIFTNFPEYTLQNNYITIGADGVWKANSRSWLSMKASYTYSSLSVPFDCQALEDYDQKANDINAEVMWRSKAGRVKYYIGAEIDRFALTGHWPQELMDKTPVAQTTAGFSGGVGLCESGLALPWLGIDMSWISNHSNRVYFSNIPGGHYGAATRHEGNFKPYFIVDIDKVHLRIGMNLSVAAGHDGGHVRVAPDASVTYMPAAAFTFYASLSGGEYINTMRDIFHISPYVNPYTSYGRSNVPCRVEGGVNILPLNALKLKVNGGYAVGKDIAVPRVQIPGTFPLPEYFMEESFNSWHIGAEASYNIRNLATLSAFGRVAGSNHDVLTWIDWHDCAKYNFGAGLDVTPTENLDIDITYNVRIDRRTCSLRMYETGKLSRGYTDGAIDLGAIRSLDLGASYRITPSITAFAKVENLLGKHYCLIGGIPAQSVKGLVGVAVKF